MAAERISEPAVVWKDRKRICGLPITFTKYSMSEDRLFLETGLLNTRQEEVILYRVRDISLTISLWQRIFRVGSVLVQSSDKSLPRLLLKNIREPRGVKELIHKQVETGCSSEEKNLKKPLQIRSNHAKMMVNRITLRSGE